MQNLSRRIAEVKEKRTQERTDLEALMHLYTEPCDRGGVFVHVQQAASAVWSEECLKEIQSRPDVVTVVADACMYDLSTRDKHERVQVPARRAMKFMTSSRRMAQGVQRRCDGSHRRQSLTGGRAQTSEGLTASMCRVVCPAVMRERREKRQGLQELAIVSRESLKKLVKLPDTEQFHEADEDGVSAAI